MRRTGGARAGERPPKKTICARRLDFFLAVCYTFSERKRLAPSGVDARKGDQMPEVLQIVGSVVLLVVGVAVILYVLFRKSPVKEDPNARTAAEGENAEESDGDESEDDEIPDGEEPAEVTRKDE